MVLGLWGLGFRVLDDCRARDSGLSGSGIWRVVEGFGCGVLVRGLGSRALLQ